jgi:ABC-type polysaccharide transport system permease subunit
MIVTVKVIVTLLLLEIGKIIAYGHSARRNISRGVTPSSTPRVIGEYILKISVRKNSELLQIFKESVGKLI